MSFADFFNATAGVGNAYEKGLDDYTKKSFLAQLGDQLQRGDYAGAAQSAFTAGDASTGLAVLKLGQEQAGRQSWQNDLNTLSGLPGGVMGGSGLGSLLPPGNAGAGGGAPSSSGPLMPRAPSFSGQAGPAGSYLSTLFGKESNNNAYAQNPNSSATGLGQFTTGTWSQVAKAHPDLGLTPDGRTDADQSARATQALAQDNQQILSRAGVPLTDGNTYVAHFLGAGGAIRFIKGTANNPDAPAASYVQPDQAAANRSVFYNRDGSPKTAGQVYGSLTSRFGGGSIPADGAPPGGAPAQVASADPSFVPGGDTGLPNVSGVRPGAPRYPASSRVPPGTEAPSVQQMGTGQAGPSGGLPASQAPSAGSGMMTLPAIASGPAAPQAPTPPGGLTVASADPEVSVPGYSGTWSRSKMAAAQRSNADEYPEPNELAAAQAQAGSVGSAVAQSAPAQLAQAGAPQGAVQAYSSAAPGSQQRLNILMRLALNPNAPAGAASFFKDMYAREAKASEAPDSVKEWQWARMNGLTTAASPSAYAQEKKGTDSETPDQRNFREAVKGGFTGNFVDYMTSVRRQGVQDRGPAAQYRSREDAAKAQGLQPGTPAFQSYVLTGKLPGEDKPELSVSDRNTIRTADDQVQANQNVIDNLRQAKDVSKQAYGGLGAGVRGTITGAFGSQAGQATTDLDNLVTGTALGQLKSIFGGNPTEGERAILLQIQGSSSLPDASRQKIYDRAITLAEQRLQMNRQRADELRGGTYYQPGGGQRQGAPGQGQRPAQAMPSQGAVEAEMRRRGLMP